jgi:hypothetical protein
MYCLQILESKSKQIRQPANRTFLLITCLIALWSWRLRQCIFLQLTLNSFPWRLCVLDPRLLRSDYSQKVKVKFKVKITLWLAVYRQSVCLGVRPLKTQEQKFFQLNSFDNSPYVTSSLTRRWVFSYEYAWPFVKCTFHLYNVIEKSSFCTVYKSSVSPDFAKQIMSILLILCYNGSLVTWTVVSLTTPQFKPLIFSMSGFALSYTTNIFILMTLHDFCLSPAHFAI